MKDEPPRKKDDSLSGKVKIPVNSVASLTDGNAILPSAIQILTETDGNRLTQYKVQVHYKNKKRIFNIFTSLNYDCDIFGSGARRYSFSSSLR